MCSVRGQMLVNQGRTEGTAASCLFHRTKFSKRTSPTVMAIQELVGDIC